jgi:hypothetical protein
LETQIYLFCNCILLFFAITVLNIVFYLNWCAENAATWEHVRLAVYKSLCFVFSVRAKYFGTWKGYSTFVLSNEPLHAARTLFDNFVKIIWVCAFLCQCACTYSDNYYYAARTLFDNLSKNNLNMCLSLSVCLHIFW